MNLAIFKVTAGRLDTCTPVVKEITYQILTAPFLQSLLIASVTMDRTGGGQKKTREEISNSPSFARIAYPRLIEDMDETGWIQICSK